MAARAAELTTAAQVLSLGKSDYARHLSFSVTGVVTHAGLVSRLGPYMYLLDTGEGSVSLWSSNGTAKAGSVVKADGFTRLDSFAEDHVLMATNIETRGTAPLPAPENLSFSRIVDGEGDFSNVAASGFLYCVDEDEVDSGWSYGILNMDGKSMSIAVPKRVCPTDELRRLVDAEIDVVGPCFPFGRGKRKHLGHNIAAERIVVRRRPPEDVFATPPLEDLGRFHPERIRALHRRRVTGRVLAVWGGDTMLVREATGRIVKAELEPSSDIPRVDDTAEAVGFPETDLYFVNLSHAICRSTVRGSASTRDSPTRLASPEAIRKSAFNRKYNVDFHGRTVSLEGIVRTISYENEAPVRLVVEIAGQIVQIDVSAASDSARSISPGCRINATGVCVLETTNWTTSRALPSIHDFFVVTRGPEDVRVVSSPPWWTPRRFAVAAGSLLAVLVAILIWNLALRWLVERRSRELIKSQAEKIGADFRVDERTRIASELHDYLAQNLTAMSYQLTAAKLSRDVDPETSLKHLDTVATMLNSSRTELRRCLWDLRSEALEDPTFELAIRRTLQQILDDTRLTIDFAISRRTVSDTTAHAILSVIRELVANAINHGKAKSIGIIGRYEGGEIRITVSDDGVGFDPDARSDSSGGHFGLDGIRSRIGRLGGAVSISSSLGRGTTAAISVPLHKTAPHGGEQQ